MGLALTNLPTAWVYFNGSTTASLIAGISAALQATGWTSSLVGTSPQGLSVTLTMAVVDASTVSLTMSSASGSGVAHRLTVHANYQIWSNCCSFFISQVGQRGDYTTHRTGKGSVVVAGVPWCPPATCGGITDATAATEAWYCFGDTIAGAGAWSGSPRSRLLMFQDQTGYVAGPDLSLPGGYYNEAMWNGNYCETVQDYHTSSGSYVWAGTPEILTIQEADDMTIRTDLERDTFKYRGYDTEAHIIMPCPIKYDPLLAWGDTVTARAKIRGQIYDCLLVSRGNYRDATDASEPILKLPPTATYQWGNFTDQYYWGSLWLLVPKPVAGGLGNVAY